MARTKPTYSSYSKLQTTRLWEAMEAVAKGMSNLGKWADQFDDALAKEANPNAVGIEGHTPLTYMIEKDFGSPFLRGALRHGADSNLPDRDGALPLQLAANHRDWLSYCHVLSEYGVNLNATWENSAHSSLRSKIWNSVQDLPPENYQHLLENWLAKGFVLIDADGQIDDKDARKYFRREFNFGTLKDSEITGMAEFLCKNNLVHVTDDGERTFYERYLDQLPIETAAKLLEAGADPNRRHRKANTPLFFDAVRNLEMLKLLGEHGADFSLTDDLSRNILHTLNDSAESPLRETVAFLTAGGADINHVDTDGRTPLLEAIKKEYYPNHIRALLENGAVPDADCFTLDAPDEYAEALLAHGFNVMLPVENGKNMLRHLFSAEHRKLGSTVKEFIRIGAPVFQRDPDGGSLYDDILTSDGDSLDSKTFKIAIRDILIPYNRLQDALKKASPPPLANFVGENDAPTEALMAYAAFGLLPELLDARHYTGREAEAKHILAALPNRLSETVDATWLHTSEPDTFTSKIRARANILEQNQR